MRKELKTQDLIDIARKSTVLTGYLYDIQLNNLKKWPFFIFDSLESVELEYDLTKNGKSTKEGDGENYSETVKIGNNSIIVYRLFFKKGYKLPKDRGIRFEALHSWIKNILWSDINLTVIRNNKEIYKK